MVALNEIAELSRRIAEEFRPEKIILFGSHAYGTPKEFSDIDLLIIMPFQGHPFDQATEILARVPHRGFVDVVVQTPDEASRRYRELDPLTRDAFDRGTVLYARKG